VCPAPGEWGNIVIDGNNQAAALSAFYTGKQKTFIAGQAYPCASCCSP
jgi:hypothetical protein